MHKRTKTTIVIVGVILLLLAGAVYLRRKSPPEAARLLPESDGIVYLNLRPLRTATHFDQTPVRHDPDYQKFIDATGIEFERDLDEAAFAVHRMADPSGPNGPVGFSTVFVGKIDGKRLAKFLEGASASTEQYEGHTIYNIPVEGRTDRVVLLGYDIVACSNMPTTEQIHSMLDRYRSAALPFPGSTLLSQHYHEIPLLSLAWGIGKIGLPLSDNEGGLKVLGMPIPMAVDATFIASLRWAGSLHLRVEEIAPSEAAATSSAESMDALLSLARAAEAAQPTSTGADATFDAGVKELLNSARVEHRKDRAVVTASVPTALLQYLATSTSGAAPAAAPVPSH